MYDIDTKNVKKGYKVFTIFLVVGIIFFVVIAAILVFNKKKQNSLDASTMSTRIEVSEHIDDEGTTMYSPVYYFEVRGEEFKCTSNSSSSIYPKTESQMVYYDSKDPHKCMTAYSVKGNKILLLVLLLPTIFILVAVLNYVKTNKRIKAINELNQKGKLIKKLPYVLEDTGTVINGVPIRRPVVEYELSTGERVTLKGDPRYDHKTSDDDGFVDLVIDEQNPKNYFIDFEINRLTGNTPADYNQKLPKEPIPVMQAQPQVQPQVQMAQPQVQQQAPVQQPQSMEQAQAMQQAAVQQQMMQQQQAMQQAEMQAQNPNQQ